MDDNFFTLISILNRKTQEIKNQSLTNEKCHPRDQLFSKFIADDENKLEFLKDPEKFEMTSSLHPDFG